MKNLIVSLSIAKKLKKVGFPQEELSHYWVEFEHNSIYEDKGLKERTHIFTREEVNDSGGGKYRNFWQNMERGKGIDNIFAAPLAEEILNELPEYIEKIGDILAYKKVFKGDDKIKYVVDYRKLLGFVNEKLSEAAAEMYIYLRKEKLI